MKLVDIGGLSTNRRKVEKLAKQIIREAVFDDAIQIVFPVPECFSVWVYDLDAEIGRDAQFAGANVYEESMKGVKADGIQGLLVDTLSLISLEKYEVAEVQGFDEAASWSEDKDDFEVVPRGVFSVDLTVKPAQFYLFRKDKQDEDFLSEVNICARVSVHDLSVVIDINKVRDLEKLRELVPEAFELPSDIQEKLIGVPKDMSKLPSRLRGVWEVYLSTWRESYSPGKEIDKREVELFNKKVVGLLVDKFQREERRHGRPLGLGVAKCVAEMLKPDYLKHSIKDSSGMVSLGVPSLFYILNALIELFVVRDEFDADIVDFDEEIFSNVLFAVSRPEVKSELNGPEHEIFDYLSLVYPEIASLRYAEFSKKAISKLVKLCY